MNLNKIGQLGEDITVKFLIEKGFKVSGRNYLKKQGEIDIIAIKAGIHHFIEVKAVSREIINNKPIKGDFVEPEENMHMNKIRRLRNSIEIYLQSNNVPRETFIFDLCVVYVDERRKKACVKFLEDLALEVVRF
ncbi:MAG: YraN family protein [bacterium]